MTPSHSYQTAILNEESTNHDLKKKLSPKFGYIYYFTEVVDGKLHYFGQLIGVFRTQANVCDMFFKVINYFRKELHRRCLTWF